MDALCWRSRRREMMEEVYAIAACQPTAQPKHPDVRATQMNIELFHNVCYIVCCVVIEGGKVLMVQEAKPSCRGKWYLPAGRMERNETIVEAVKREVKEESGLDFEPEGVLSIECHAHTWVRITLGGKIVGGALKTVANADQESLQAQWQPADKTELLGTVHILSDHPLDNVDLRSHDILKLISIATKWYSSGKPFRGIPVPVGHTSCSLRMVVVHETASHDLKVLVREEERGGVKTTRLPVCLFSHDDGGGIIANTVQKLLKECGYEERFSVMGVLQIEHVGQTGRLDGFCLSLLVHATSCKLVSGARWRWEGVEEEACRERLRTALRDDGCTRLIDLKSR